MDERRKNSTGSQCLRPGPARTSDEEDVWNVPPPSAWAKRPRLVSLVVPIFCEEEGLTVFCDALMQVLDDLELPVEVLFIEDDSPDASFQIVRELQAKYPGRVKGLSLSRRFGHQASLAAGFQHAQGDVVICMDGDLQHPPALLPALLWRWSQGNQVVYTRRLKQIGRSPAKEYGSKLFYGLMNKVSEVPFEDGIADFRLMDRVVVDALNRFSERWLFFRGLVAWAGFRRVAVEYEAPERYAGVSQYNFRRMLRMAVDALFTFSLLPLRLSYYLGAVTFVGSFFYMLWSLVDRFIGPSEAPGYASIVSLLVMLSSIQLLCIGIASEYIGRVHEQVKGRPLYLVKERVGFEEAAAPSQEKSRIKAYVA